MAEPNDMAEPTLRRNNQLVPLAYVTRLQVEVLPEEDDNATENWDQELIRRTSHNPTVNGTYVQDNQTVFQILFTICHEGASFTWIRKFQRTSDGRGAYFAFKSHYLGKSFQETITAKAEKRLETTIFNGKNRHHNIDGYLTIITDSLQKVEDGYGQPKSDYEKVTRLLRGLTDPKAQSMKGTILANEHLRLDYEKTLEFIKTSYSFTDDSNTSVQQRNVAAVDQGKGRRKRGRGRASGGGNGEQGQDGQRYSSKLNILLTGKSYEADEFHSFTPDEKAYVKRLRQEKARARNNSSQRNVSATVRFTEDTKEGPPSDNTGAQMKQGGKGGQKK